MRYIKDLWFNNVQVKAGIIVMLIILTLTFIWSRPITKEWLKNFNEMNNQRRESIIKDIEEEKELYKTASEELSKKYLILEKEKQKLIVERKNRTLSIDRLSKEIEALKIQKTKALPKEHDEKVKAFRNLGFDVIYMDCK